MKPVNERGAARDCTLPYSEAVNPDMHRELKDLVDNRTAQLARLREI